jgi:hypothetical protein
MRAHPQDQTVLDQTVHGAGIDCSQGTLFVSGLSH